MLNLVRQWLSANAPVLALALAAMTLLLVVVLVVLLLRVARERVMARRDAQTEISGPFRAGEVGSAAALRRAADLQATALDAIGVIAEQAEHANDRSTALAVSIALGDFERVQAELDTALATAPEEEPGAAIDRLLAGLRDFGIQFQLVEHGSRRPLRAGYEASVISVLREALQAIVQEAPIAPTALVRLDWLASDLLVQIEQASEDLPVWSHEHALGLVPREDLEDFGTSTMRHHVERYGGVFVDSRVPGARLIRALFPSALGEQEWVHATSGGRA